MNEWTDEGRTAPKVSSETVLLRQVSDREEGQLVSMSGRCISLGELVVFERQQTGCSQTI